MKSETESKSEIAPAPFVLGISGLTSSGKTTLSRLLRSIFPESSILHEDDFFVSDDSLPIVGGLQDWDCVEAIKFSSLIQTLDHLISHGVLPLEFQSKEDQNAIGEVGVTEQEVEVQRKKARDSGVLGVRRVVILDGFLLFHDEEILSRLHGKIFLRARQDSCRKRREARNGYATIEGFWTDPPGYFDKIVWPNYVKNHKHLFINDDVAGLLKPEVLTEKKIHSPKHPEMPMNEVFAWAVDLLINEIRGQSGGCNRVGGE
ncbi:ribosylnicotinamide kinase [Rhizina undulata]